MQTSIRGRGCEGSRSIMASTSVVAEKICVQFAAWAFLLGSRALGERDAENEMV